MQLEHKPSKLLITGKSGCGKSTFFNRYLLNCWHHKVFVFDHEGEFAYRNGVPPCYEITAEHILANRYIAFDPTVKFPGDLNGAFDYYCELCFLASKSAELASLQKLFATDELQKVVSTTQVTYELALLIETGRRYGIDTAFVSQQPNLIHNRLRNQLTEVVSFAQIERRATVFLEDLGFDAADLATLDELEFLDLDLRTMQLQRGNLRFDKSSPTVSKSDQVQTVQPNRAALDGSAGEDGAAEPNAERSVE